MNILLPLLYFTFFAVIAGGAFAMKGKNISEFARIYNLNVSALYDIKRGRRKQYNGWKLK
jgi:hypothetical protein